LFDLELTDKSKETYNLLKANPSDKTRYNAVKKTLNYLAQNPHHNSLQTHPFLSLKGPHGEKVFEAYAQQKTPAAYRVFWYYGSTQKTIVILAITPHP
jgi:translation elongation factor EF-1alpha